MLEYVIAFTSVPWVCLSKSNGSPYVRAFIVNDCRSNSLINTFCGRKGRDEQFYLTLEDDDGSLLTLEVKYGSAQKLKSNSSRNRNSSESISSPFT